MYVYIYINIYIYIYIHIYIYITIHTDHKPVKTIFQEGITGST